MTLRHLLNERLGATIHCLYTGTTVRTLAATGDYCDLRAGDGSEVAIHLDESLVYRESFLDRGSILIKSCDAGMIKLLTEGDGIRYEDGAEKSLYRIGFDDLVLS